MSEDVWLHVEVGDHVVDIVAVVVVLSVGLRVLVMVGVLVGVRLHVLVMVVSVWVGEDVPEAVGVCVGLPVTVVVKVRKMPTKGTPLGLSAIFFSDNYTFGRSELRSCRALPTESLPRFGGRGGRTEASCARDPKV